jgi:hypothetical protein
MRIRTPPASRRLLPLLILLALAGCGGGEDDGDDGAAPARPTLAAAPAERLAARSDTIAAKLAAGDECGAAHEADALAADAIAAVNAGEVPAPYQEELVARTQELVNAVNCPPPVVQAPPEADEDEDDDDDEPGRGKKKGHKKKKGDG